MTIVTERTKRRGVTIMTTQPFNQEQALKDYAELKRLISVESTSERKEAVHNLEIQAAKYGLVFVWHADEKQWALEPMSEAEKGIYKAVTEEESESPS